MPFTLQNCYDRLQQDILDDPNARRFTDARCFRALTDALGECQVDLANAVVPLFLKYEDLTTTNGAIAFSAFTDTPLRVTKIAQRLNSGWQTIAQAIDPMDQVLDLDDDVNVRVHFWPKIAGPATASATTDYLVGGGAAARGDSNDAFELWVVYEAALKLRRLDASGQGETKLHELRNDSRERCLELKVGPSQHSRRKRRRNLFNNPLRWYQNNDELIFSR
jgi:hypothetical protein